WTAISSGGRSYPHYKFLSTKAAFGWSVLEPENDYTQRLRNDVQTLGDKQHGYFAGRYEDPQLGPNRVFNINTNAIILETLLYQAQGYRPLIES
ncbi:MAG: DUF3131 domain-containing protein, partial [Leptolyngbya sp. SIO3F4]|nr:DUF3131 domain-containing protein [Leptolyngbya sp. SIO3F4]